MLFSFRTLLFITSLFVSAGTWSSCIKVTDKSALYIESHIIAEERAL
ncbi:hypothetical protein SeGA_0474 [Salmonella enterica subsp. enterica serovar Gaminara str. A4-567]|nr:hypothetical protein SeGA_0474 [Salmonella enterica subsp. enterica serovar Gaminara str. A4-567]